jgi:hypothetical protein
MLTAAPNHRAGVALRETAVAVCDAMVSNVQVFRKNTAPKKNG